MSTEKNIEKEKLEEILKKLGAKDIEYLYTLNSMKDDEIYIDIELNFYMTREKFNVLYDFIVTKNMGLET